ncbi:hypothetical protein ACFOWZ_47635 [Lentzea rhizosphaerae]|uniref:Lipoprotein n=1 Tax=Lentzea rhizosphaerae TaxID=2041025 RepID=A0ABV8CBQ6_9PSEU
MKRSIVLVAVALGLTACTATPAPEQNAAFTTQPPSSTTTPTTSVVTRTPAPKAVTKADNRVGYGALKLGMTLEEARATGQTDLTWEGAGDNPCVADGKVTISRKQGVVRIFLPADARTSKGIGIGSTFADVKRAYPDAHEYRAGWTAAVDGDSHYAFLSSSKSEDYHALTEEVAGIKLLANGADCVLSLL